MHRHIAGIKEKESSYRLFFEAGVEGMLLARGGGIILDANPRACDLLHRTREDLVGSRLDDLCDPSYPILQAGWERLRETGSFYVTARLLRGDGSYFPAEVSGFGEGESRIGVTFKEITQHEEAAQTSAAEYRAMVESSLDAMVICNIDNTCRYANPAWEQLLGYKPEELVGMFIPDLVHPEDLLRIASENAQIHNSIGPARLMQARYRHKDGSWRYLDSTRSGSRARRARTPRH